MSGMPEARAIEYVFRNRIGDYSGGPPGDRILDGVAD
jgi:hypothetical protein